MGRSALVFISDGSEEVETVAVVDVLRRAGVETVIVGVGVECECYAVGSHGIGIGVDKIFANVPSPETFDAVVIPGGMAGVDKMMSDQDLLSFLKKYSSDESKIVAAICAGPLVLQKAGAGKGATITTYPSLSKMFDLSHYSYVDQDVVKHNNIITSQSPCTALKFATTIVEHLLGNEKRLWVEQKISGK